MPDKDYGSVSWIEDHSTDQTEVVEIPCFACGKPVLVTTYGGIFSGCVYCEECMAGRDGTWQYREQF